MEAHPASDLSLENGIPGYKGIGRMMIAYGIKLPIDHGLAGDVVLGAKAAGSARHYEKDLGAILLPSFESSAPSYLIADEAAIRISFTYPCGLVFVVR